MESRIKEPETEITVKVPKSKLSKLKALLKEENIKIKKESKKKEQLPNGFIKGKYKPGDKPGDAAGIWEDDERDENEIRRAAWHNRGVNW